MKYRLAAIFIGVFACATLPVKAQYLGDQLLGLTGLKAGTQPEPGIYVTVPLYYRWNDVSIYNAQGNQIAKDATGAINLFMLPAAQVVTPFKILGATYSAGYTEWIVNGVVNVAARNFSRSSSYGFGDIYVQPAILGWHTAFADVTTGYAFFAPTGGSHGQNMWINEADFGLTLYPDPGKKWNVSTMTYFDFNQTKNNKDIKVGDILTMSGGAGRSFLKGAANLGAAYSAQWKLTHDSGSDIPALLPITNGRVFGVGPELDMPVFAKGHNVGLVSFRYLWMLGPKTYLGGQLLNVSFTFARLRRSL
jgi:hypothetical protein